jgi:hypothetical protein
MRKEELCGLAQRLHGCEIGIAAHLGACEVIFDFARARDADAFIAAVHEEVPATGILSQAGEHCLLTTGAAPQRGASVAA